MIKIFILTILSIEIIYSAPKAPIHEKNLSSFFEDYQVSGSFLLYDLKNNEYIAYNKKRCKKGFLPASTFKIINSLIGLETGVIPDENYIIKWDGVIRDISPWNQDHTLNSAFRVSCVPYYQELARRVGVEKMKYFTSRSKYGKMDISENNLDKFWLEGKSRISQKEQIDFLVNFYNNQLPFSPATLAKVKNIMLVEENEQYNLRAKTGWTFQDGIDIGWYVGYIEKEDQVYFFATQIESPKPDNDLFNRGRKEITMKIIRSLDIL
ncbi:OXA-48 family carbapenem-hydrolyzing class D beta-lactamase OXA-54 [soil metagenome]